MATTPDHEMFRRGRCRYVLLPYQTWCIFTLPDQYQRGQLLMLDFPQTSKTLVNCTILQPETQIDQKFVWGVVSSRLGNVWDNATFYVQYFWHLAVTWSIYDMSYANICNLVIPSHSRQHYLIILNNFYKCA